MKSSKYNRLLSLFVFAALTTISTSVLATARPDLVIGQSSGADQISPEINAENVNIRNNNQNFVAQDVSSFTIVTRFIHAIQKHPQANHGGGRSHFNAANYTLFINGSLELYQTAGQPLVFSRSDSQGISNYLKLTKFPSILDFSNQEMLKHKDSFPDARKCLLTCKSNTECRYQEFPVN